MDNQGKNINIKGELLCFSVFSDQCWIFVLNDAKTSHNEIHAFGSEPCRLFQLALLAVFYGAFNSIFPATLMCSGHPYMGM